VNLAWLYTVNIVLLSRVLFVSRDSKVYGWEIFAAYLIQQLSLLVFESNRVVLMFSIFLAMLALIWWGFENWASKKQRRATGQRLLLLPLYLIGAGIFSANRTSQAFRPQLYALRHAISPYLAPFAPVTVDPVVAQIYLFGLLLCITEANLIVRFILQRLDLPPEKHRHQESHVGTTSTTSDTGPPTPMITATAPTMAGSAPGVDEALAAQAAANRCTTSSFEVRIGEEGPKGYERPDFQNAFDRYLPVPGDLSVTA
jgi:hypothetical protein